MLKKIQKLARKFRSRLYSDSAVSSVRLYRKSKRFFLVIEFVESTAGSEIIIPCTVSSTANSMMDIFNKCYINVETNKWYHELALAK